MVVFFKNLALYFRNKNVFKTDTTVTLILSNMNKSELIKAIAEESVNTN
jgi:hypothetical protein